MRQTQRSPCIRARLRLSRFLSFESPRLLEIPSSQLRYTFIYLFIPRQSPIPEPFRRIQPLFVLRYTYVTRNSRADKKGEVVGPGQQLVLFPPSLYHQAHVKSQHERHRYRLARIAKVVSDLFEDSATDRSPHTLIACITSPFFSKKTLIVCYWGKEGEEGGRKGSREGGVFRARSRVQIFVQRSLVVEFSRRRLSNKWSKVEVIPSLGQIPPLPVSRTGNALGKWEFPSKFHSCSRKSVSGSDPRVTDPRIRGRSTFTHRARRCYIQLRVEQRSAYREI